MALRALSPEAARTLIDRMLADLARMEPMVTQILESARLERGRVDFKSEPLELAAAVARVVAQLEERARRSTSPSPATSPRTSTCVTDPLALDVVVRNVLENALAAVQRGGGDGTGSIASARVPATARWSCR